MVHVIQQCGRLSCWKGWRLQQTHSVELWPQQLLHHMKPRYSSRFNQRSRGSCRASSSSVVEQHSPRLLLCCTRKSHYAVLLPPGPTAGPAPVCLKGLLLAAGPPPLREIMRE